MTQRDIYITGLKLSERQKRAEISRDRVFRLLEKAPLPGPIVAALRRGEVPKRDEVGTFLFADIVGFTSFSGTVSAKQLVKILNSLFISCDNAARESGVTKIKTLGDCYVAATGILGDVAGDGGDEGEGGHAGKMCRFSLRLHECMSEMNEEHGLTPPLRWRIGMHSGACIGGVIGSKKCVRVVDTHASFTT
jgi:class 3 adenylate cyclase